MDFVSAEELYGVVKSTSTPDGSLLAEVIQANHIVIPTPLMTIIKENLQTQSLEYAKTMEWDEGEMTVFYYNSSSDPSVYKCLYAMDKWENIRHAIQKTLKLKAFL
jgi:hypothetical protein